MKKFKINNNFLKWGITAFLVIAAGILFYYLIFHISEIFQNIRFLLAVIKPVVFGMIIAYLFTPILNFAERKFLNPLFNLLKINETKKRQKWVRAIAVVLTTLFVLFILYILISMLVSEIVPSIQAIVTNFDRYYFDFINWLNKLLDDNLEVRNYVLPLVSKLSSELNEWLTDTATLLTKSSELLKTLSLSIISFLKATWNFIIGFVISIYLLASKETFAAQGKKFIYAILDTDKANSILKSLRFVHRTFSGFISGKVLDSIIIGLLCFIGTTFLGTPYAVLVSVIVGVTNLIPVLGPYIGAIPSAFLILIVDLSHPQNCLYFVIFIIILQQIDGNLIGPKILGDSTGLSGFWVIFSITIFGGFFDVPGMIVGVPLFAVIFAAIKEYINRSLKHKKMPLNTSAYMNASSIRRDGENYIIEEEPYWKPLKKKKLSTTAKIGNKLFGRKKDKKDIQTDEPTQKDKDED